MIPALLFIVGLESAGTLPALPTQTSRPPVVVPGVGLTRSTDRGVSLTFGPGRLTVGRSSDGRAVVRADSADNAASPGQYDLPERRVRIGIPGRGWPRISVVSGRTERLAAEPAAVPRVSFERGASAGEDPVGRRKPTDWVEVSDSGLVRGVRFLELTLRPVRFAPDGGLESTDRLDVHVEFSEPGASSGPGDRLARAALLNGDEAQFWRVETEPSTAADFFGRSPNWLRIALDSSGIYGLTYDDLADAGVPVAGLDPRTFALFGTPAHVPNAALGDSLHELPIAVAGQEDGRFDHGDQVVFYAQGADYWQPGCSLYVKNLYTRHNQLWLTWGGQPGSRMRSGLAPDTAGTAVVSHARWVVHRERDADCPARSGLLWIWTYLYKPPSQAEATFSFDLSLPDPVSITRLSGRLMSLTGDNLLSLRFNRREVAALQFGQAQPSAPFDFSLDTALAAGSRRNVVELGLGGNGTHTAYVDYFDVEYRRWLALGTGRLDFLQDDTGRFRFRVSEAGKSAWILDVTDAEEPRLVSDYAHDGGTITFCWRVPRPARFAACTGRGLRRPVELTLRTPGRLSRPTVQADYWIITPSEFAGPAQRLAEYRTGRIPGVGGGRAAVALLEDVYDDYSFGMAEPVAVKRFLADKRPQYALLVGDATCDYRGLLSENRPPGVPPYETGYGLDAETYDRTAVAYDAWYADFEGEGGSPDVMLGRITARSGSELRRYVDKVIRYETEPTGQWASRYLLFADDEFFGVEDPDDPRTWDPIRFGHVATCEYLTALPDNLLQPVKVYLTEYPYAGVKNKPLAHAAVMRELDAGGLVLVFVGHGSGFDLTHESVLNISHVPTLNNDGRLPFCYFGSCSVGRFDDTQFECIAEELVRIPAGAIASVAATKATTSGSNQVFARNLLTPLFTLPDSSMGFAFFLAWPTDRIYHFFGDPATVLRLPVRSQQDLSFSPDTLRPGRPFRGRGIVELADARFEWTLFGPRLARTYRSFLGEATYEMPGWELARGNGRLDNGQLHAGGTFPVGAPLDTVFVANGWYSPVIRSCRLRAIASTATSDLAVLRDTITYSPERWASDDSAGPAVTFWLAGRELRDDDAVPAEPSVEIRCADSSGIAIAPVRGTAPEAWVDDRRASIDVSRKLVFDEGTSTRASFLLPLRLDGPVDSLFVAVSDNQQNRTVARVRLRPALSDVLRVESALVFPNPVAGPASISFTLTRPAAVQVRVYSLSGRLVRDLGSRFCGFGYNDFAWDGRDRDGRLPGNGVYLFTVTAECEDGGGRRQRVVARDRLVVYR